MSTRLRVRLHPDTLTPPVLISVKRDTVLGLSEIRARVDAGEPVLDVGMSTNGWYDAAAHSLLMTLAEWDDSGVGWSAVEIGDGGPDRDDVPVTLDYLRNVIDSDADDERTRPWPSRWTRRR